jgi:hypothetical protein
LPLRKVRLTLTLLLDDLNVFVLIKTSVCNGFTGPAFLSFSPSEIAATVALAAVSENQILGFEGVLEAFEIPINKVIILSVQRTDQCTIVINSVSQNFNHASSVCRRWL